MMNHRSRSAARSNAPNVSGPGNQGTSVNNVQNESDNRIDGESVKGRFGWKKYGSKSLPFIVRVVNEVRMWYIPMRIVKWYIRDSYLHSIEEAATKCSPVPGRPMTEAEANLMDEINGKHGDFLYGNERFVPDTDMVVSMVDMEHFIAFLKACHNRMRCADTLSVQQEFGFVRIETYGSAVVPYIWKNNAKHLPLFRLPIGAEILMFLAVRTNYWEMARLKFCLQVQGVSEESFVGRESCLVVSLDEIRNHYPPETTFVEYWPASDTATYFQNVWRTYTPFQPHHTPVSPPVSPIILQRPASSLTTDQMEFRRKLLECKTQMTLYFERRRNAGKHWTEDTMEQLKELASMMKSTLSTHVNYSNNHIVEVKYEIGSFKVSASGPSESVCSQTCGNNLVQIFIRCI